MEVHPLESCGNSPKNQLVHDLCLKHVQERSGIAKVLMLSAICHGNVGAAEFEVVTMAGETRRGCLVMEFQTAAAKNIVRTTEYWSV